jgi:hypothetical protein
MKICFMIFGWVVMKFGFFLLVASNFSKSYGTAGSIYAE